MPLTSVWRADLAKAQRGGQVHWEVETADASDVPEPADTMLRSHLSAASLPGGPVLVFGGARYFTGAYFHDLLELSGGPGPGGAQAARPEAAPAGAPGGLGRLGSLGGLGGLGGLRQLLQQRLRSQPAAPGPRTPRGPAATGARGRAGRLAAMARDGLEGDEPR